MCLGNPGALIPSEGSERTMKKKIKAVKPAVFELRKVRED